MYIVSAGFNKSHLITAAAELSKYELLDCLAVGAYPTSRMTKLADFLKISGFSFVKRFLLRKEVLADALVVQCFFLEFLHQVALLMIYRVNVSWLNRIGRKLDYGVFLIYGLLMSRKIKKSKAKVYLYRSGLGGRSVNIAKKLGMVTVCDHSIVHPNLLSYMVDNMGKYPSVKTEFDLDSFWTHVRNDMSNADFVLVNSNFVKATCAHQGVCPEKIKVIYLGVDENYFHYLPKRKKAKGTLRFLFAGSFEKRKGALDMMSAFLKLSDGDWCLDVVGPVNIDFHPSFEKFKSHRKIKFLGRLSRNDLAAVMSQSDVFVFPSLAEGSARVVFEALAAGLYVITTDNAGSIVVDGKHGAIVPVGDAESLCRQLEYASNNRNAIFNIGLKNSGEIKKNYTQKHYGEKLKSLYHEISFEK